MDKLKKGRVILTYGRSVMSLVAAHSLASKGLEIYACDSLDMTILKFSKHVKKSFVLSDLSDEEYIKSLEEIIIENKPDDDRPYVLMPIHKETRLIAKHKERLEKHIKVACPDHQSIAQVQPKDNFAKTVEKYDIASPKTFYLKEASEIDDVSLKLKYPCLIKPVDATGGRGIVKIKDRDSLLRLFSKSIVAGQALPIIQEFVEGEDYCFAGIFKNGELKGHMAYTNLYSFPAEAGAGCFRETVDDTKFIEKSKELAKALSWNGIAEIDFMWDGKEDSEASIIEVNPRFWGGLFQSVESGVDFPWLLYELTVTGDIVEDQEAVIGTKTKIPLIWTVAAIDELIHDESLFESLKGFFETSFKNPENKSLFSKLKSFAVTMKYCFENRTNEFISNVMPSSKQEKIPSEIFSDDDSLTPLGMLFIVSSLIKKGELPPEVKF